MGEWGSINWSTNKANNNGKSATQYLELLINLHQEINLSLPIEYDNGTIVSIKLLNAVKYIDKCKLAYFKQTDSIFFTQIWSYADCIAVSATQVWVNWLAYLKGPTSARRIIIFVIHYKMSREPLIIVKNGQKPRRFIFTILDDNFLNRAY